MVKAMHTWKPISKKPMGRPKIYGEDSCPGQMEESGWEGQNSALRAVGPY